MVIRPRFQFPVELVLLGIAVAGSCTFIAAQVIF